MAACILPTVMLFFWANNSIDGDAILGPNGKTLPHIVLKSKAEAISPSPFTMLDKTRAKICHKLF